MREEGKGCPEYEVRQYISEAAQGLAFLQLKELVHGDVRPPNLLLDKDKKVKLMGYGLGIGSSDFESMHYRSPEVWQGHPCSDKSDIWSLGCVAYELCTLKVRST